MIIAVVVIDITNFTFFHPLRHHYHYHPNDTDRHERPGNREAGRCDDRRVCVGQGQAVPKYGGHDDDVDDVDDDDGVLPMMLIVRMIRVMVRMK